MGIQVVGSITVKVKIEDKYEEMKIQGSEFGIEEDGVRHIGDDDHQYEALFKYFGDDFTISFQASNLYGDLNKENLDIEGDVKIINDNLSLKALNYNSDDY